MSDIDNLEPTLTPKRKETIVFVPGTKHQPEARIETSIAGIKFACPFPASERAPWYVFRFQKPIPYHFVEEEKERMYNWLPPVFPRGMNRKVSRTFVRLEYIDDSKTTTQLVFYYSAGDLQWDYQKEEQFTQYTQETSERLLEKAGLSEEADMQGSVVLHELITHTERVEHPIPRRLLRQ